MKIAIDMYNQFLNRIVRLEEMCNYDEGMKRTVDTAVVNTAERTLQRSHFIFENISFLLYQYL